MYHIFDIEIKKNDPFQAIRSRRHKKGKGRCDMALRVLKDNFAGKAAAAGLAGLFAVTPLTGAFAQNDQSQRAELTQVADATNISFSRDADSAANDYLRENPSAFTVSVRLGGETLVPPNRIQSVLNNDLRVNGVGNAVFFFERGQNTGGSSVVMATIDQVHGPYSLSDSRKAVPEAARQYRFDRSLALN